MRWAGLCTLAIGVGACSYANIPRTRTSGAGRIVCTRRSLDPLRDLGLGAVSILGGGVVTIVGVSQVGTDAKDGAAWSVLAAGVGLVAVGLLGLKSARYGQEQIDACERLASDAAMREKTLEDLATAAVEAAHQGDCAKAEQIDAELVAAGASDWIDGFRYDAGVVRCIPRLQQKLGPPGS